MSKIRIYELAKQLNVANKDLMEKIHSVGIEAKSHMGMLTEEEAAKVTALYQPKKEEPKKEEAKAPAHEEPEYPAEITIDDFCKVQLKVGEVIESNEVPKSKKLLRNVVKFGDEERVIFSGIKGSYAPGELVGKRVVVAYNLAPRKMMGEISQGMILCAEDSDGKLSILTTLDENFESGSAIS